MTIHTPFFFGRSIQSYGFVVKASRSWSGDKGSVLLGAETLCSTTAPMAVLRGTERVSALTRALSYWCALFNVFALYFVSGDLALTRF